MYDFLCLFPHTCASHSLLHYLNFHKDMHLASYQSILRSGVDNVLDYERNFRPFINTVGVLSKNIEDQRWVKSILNASDRKLLVQSVRDPIGAFVSQLNQARGLAIITQARGDKEEPYDLVSIEQKISDALLKYLSHAKASQAYEAESFDRHIVFDTSELKGDRVEGLLKELWIAICGNADEENLIPNRKYISLGSQLIYDLRRGGNFTYEIGGQILGIYPLVDGDPWLGSYYPDTNRYNGFTERLHSFPDINEYLPAMGLSGPLHMCARPANWGAVHPKLRPKLVEQCIPIFEKRMRTFGKYYELLKEITLFTADDFTPLQKEIFKASIQADVAKFGRLHPEIVEKWDVTNSVLDS